jgi:hypothetical protein
VTYLTKPACAVDDAGAQAQTDQRLDNQREAIGAIIARTADGCSPPGLDFVPHEDLLINRQVNHHLRSLPGADAARFISDGITAYNYETAGGARRQRYVKTVAE